MATTTSATSSTSTAAQSIIKSLGAGSGVDYASLTTELISAQFAAKTAALTTRQASVSAQISTAGTLKSSIASFSSSLQTLIAGGSLSTQPTSSDTSVLKASAVTGAKLAGLSANITVNKLATAQAATTTAAGWTKATVIGTGDLTLSFGTASADASGKMTGFTADPDQKSVTIKVTDGTLQGVADAINAAKAGVTASIITDANGARLMVKGTTGEVKGFSLTAAEGSPLEQVNIGKGATSSMLGTVAGDAEVTLDGVSVTRATNSFSDLVAGVKIDLLAAKPGSTVTLGFDRPVDGLKEAVNSFVETYNSMKAVIDEATDYVDGTLKQDPAVRAMSRSLSGITLQPLRVAGTPGEPTTLSDLGVKTNRNGTLEVDATRLASVLAQYPDAVEEIFSNTGTGATNHGLNGALSAIATTAASTTYGIAGSVTRYTQQQSDLADQQTKLSEQKDSATTRMTKLFAATETRVSALQASQKYIEQQIAAWNSDDD
ncbi:flagellar filament capping protein FliD [Sphingomonas aracearum]|uniref:Flagellar hook-associated protein 2 n=1 Tax=Sphingomonas aracearum TaxID=2283317 RepID=A0A369VVN3_9SPHN|nr:flagellar filament capping protein FliD [Sphingomonas aracearum]RDE05909.1 flagellar hook protein [Sphingomonas aracearum]